MSRSGSWLILIDSEKEVTGGAIAQALGSIEGATVRAPEGDACSVEYKGCTIGVGIETGDHVRPESAKLAAEFGTKHREQHRIARCERRFVLTFQYDDAMIISNAMCDIESQLALLVEENGGRTFAYNPQTTEFF